MCVYIEDMYEAAKAGKHHNYTDFIYAILIYTTIIKQSRNTEWPVLGKGHNYSL